jgi:hypothetical protein
MMTHGVTTVKAALHRGTDVTAIEKDAIPNTVQSQGGHSTGLGFRGWGQKKWLGPDSENDSQPAADAATAASSERGV